MISHPHKCIFIHIPKTAGMSINTFFHKNVVFKKDNPDYERLFGWCPKRQLHLQHATAKQLLELELVSEEVWNEYFKFSFVRNPWDRAYSDYIWVQRFSGVKGNFKNFINKEKEFKSILNNSTNSNYLGDHLQAQSCFFDEEGPYQINFMGRFENLKTDMETILKRLSIHTDFNLFENKSDRMEDYSLFYTNSMKRLIEEHYSTDILRFKYSFDDHRKGLYTLKKFF